MVRTILHGNRTECASGFERYGRRKQVIQPFRLLAINEGDLRCAVPPPHSLPQTLHSTGRRPRSGMSTEVMD